MATLDNNSGVMMATVAAVAKGAATVTVAVGALAGAAVAIRMAVAVAARSIIKVNVCLNHLSKRKKILYY